MKTSIVVRDFIAGRLLLRPATIAWYRRLLGRFAELCPTLPLEPLDISLYLNALREEGLADETIHGHWRALRALYRDLHLRTGAPNPLERMRRPKARRRVPRTFHPDELFGVLAHPLSVRDRTLLSLLLDSGVRAGEAVGLRWPDVHGPTIRVDGKTGERLVPISPQVQALLRLLHRDGDDGAVFTGKRGPLTYQGVYKAVRKACARAGLSGRRLSPHTLRHTNGTLMVSAGCDLRTVQALLGHATIRQTEQYVHQDLTPLVSKHNQFSPLRLVAAAAQGAFALETPAEASKSTDLYGAR